MNVRLHTDSPESDLLPISNWRLLIQRTLLLFSLLLLTGCFTDASTRIAYDIEAAARRVGNTENSQFTLARRHIEKCAVNTEPTEQRSAKRPSGSGSDHEVAFAAQPPWSSVNNCTKTRKARLK